jgi:hypothetical protein
MEAKIGVRLVPSISLREIDYTSSSKIEVQNEYSDTTFFSDIDTIIAKPSKVGYELVELS